MTSFRAVRRFSSLVLSSSALLASVTPAGAQAADNDKVVPGASTTVGPSGPPPESEAGEPVQKRAPIDPVANGERTKELSPKPALPPPTKLRFVADPVSDGAVLSFALGIGALSEAIIGTEEIQPQQPNLNASLLSIDRSAVDLAPSSGWKATSNVGLIGAIGFALVDPVLSGFRSGTQAGIVDAIIYGETIGITWSVTNLTKIAFRRPRPSAYQQARRRDAAGLPPDAGTTNSALSFFSGHASIVSSVSATATYLAFSRSPGTPRAWLTLGLGGLATTLVSYARVRAGEHFPTDVIAGSMAGAGIGILVPHLHRSDEVKRRPIWIGAAPVQDGFTVTASGIL
jgi:membrane-associated phospholipid phosphatase